VIAAVLPAEALMALTAALGDPDAAAAAAALAEALKAAMA